MPGTSTPFTAIIVGLFENDAPNAVADYEPFKAEYSEALLQAPGPPVSLRKTMIYLAPERSSASPIVV